MKLPDFIKFKRSNSVGDNSEVSLRRLFFVFAVSFLILFFIFNFQTVISYLGLKFESKESENERLTNFYRGLYGYEARIKRGEIKAETADVYFREFTPTPRPSVAASITSTPQNPQSENSQIVSGDYIYIPRINIKAPLIKGGSTNQSQILKDLLKGVLIYPGSALPGQSGGTIIIGHSSSAVPGAKYGAIFSLLSRLENGDAIYLSYDNRNFFV